MFRFILIVGLLLLSLTTQNNEVADYTEIKIVQPIVRYDNIVLAMVYVESSGNRFAYNVKEKAAGILQIRPIMLKHINQISKLNFTLEDRFDSLKSVEMFLIFQKHHNPEMDLEKAARYWNGNPNWKTSKPTEKYYQRVLASFNKISAQ